MAGWALCVAVAIVSSCAPKPPAKSQHQLIEECNSTVPHAKPSSVPTPKITGKWRCAAGGDVEHVDLVQNGSRVTGTVTAWVNGRNVAGAWEGETVGDQLHFKLIFDSAHNGGALLAIESSGHSMKGELRVFNGDVCRNIHYTCTR